MNQPLVKKQPSPPQEPGKILPANRINMPPNRQDYENAARRLLAKGYKRMDDASLEECQQAVADAQASRVRMEKRLGTKEVG
jgi:hypothetical protein